MARVLGRYGLTITFIAHALIILFALIMAQLSGAPTQ